MTVAIRNDAPQGTTAPTTSWTLTIPSNGGSADDAGYVAVTSRGHTAGTAYPSVTDNSGDGQSWTLIGESADRKATLWFKRFNKAMAGSVITVAGCVDSCSGGYAAFSGAETSGDPHTNLSVETNAAGNESHAGFTPDFADSMLVLVIFNSTDDSASTPTAPAGLTEMWDQISTGGNDCACAMSSVLQVGGPSATGNFTWTQANDAGYSMVFAVKPPQGGGAAEVLSGVGALVLAGFAAIVAVTDNKTVTPGAGELALTGFAPSVVASDHKTVTPGMGALTLEGHVATVTIGVNVRPGVGSLDLTGFSPSVATPRNVTPGVGALALSGFAPIAAAGVNARPDAGALTLSGFEPTVTPSAHQLVQPGAGALALAGFPPTAIASDHQSVTPDVGALSLTGFAPSIQAGVNAQPGPGALVLTGFAPTVAATSHQTVTPGAGALTVAGFAPTVATPIEARPGAGALALSGFAPTVAVPVAVTPGLGVLTLTAFEPTVQGSEPSALIIATRIVLGAVGQHVNRQPENRRISISDAPRSVALKSQQTDIPDE